MTRLITSRSARLGVVVLSLATLYHLLFGYSDAIGTIGLAATVVTLPGMAFCRQVLGLEPVGVWFSGSYPIAMLGTQFILNVSVWLAFVALSSGVRHLVRGHAA